MLICFRFFLEFDFAKHESNAETPVLLVLLVPVLELWTSMSGPAPRLGPRGRKIISFLTAFLYLFHAACILFVIQDLSLGLYDDFNLHRKLRNLNFLLSYLNRLAPVSRRPGKIVVVDHLTTSGSTGNLSY